LRLSFATLHKKLGEPVDAASLGLFRVVWGVLMTQTGVMHVAQVDAFSAKLFHVTYTFFPFVRPWSEDWLLAAEAWGLIACGVAITLGVGFRWATLAYTLLYSHFFLIEKLIYNNHYYLTILVGFLLALSRADACYSVAHWRARRRSPSQALPSVPFWNLVLLRGQVCVLYFFGGLAKLNADWLQGEPIRLWLRSLKPLPPVSWVAREEWFTNFVCMSGIVIDLSAGFLLLSRRTFWPAAFVLASFHLTNNLIFPIGIFPWIGISLLLPFLEPSWPRRAAAWLRSRLSGRPALAPRFRVPPGAPASAAVTAGVLAYLAIQVLVPLRIQLYSQDPGWTEVGQLFSWRMMLRFKDAYLRLDFDPPEAGRALKASGRMPQVSKENYRKLVKIPDAILQYVHALDAELEKLGHPDVAIRVISIASLNGRPYQLMIDPERDLTQAGYGLFAVPDWILPLAPDQRVGQYPKGKHDRRRMLQRAVDDYRREHPSLRPIRVRGD
jgi:hypothetical protein